MNTKIKKGDLVKLKENLEVGKLYSNITLKEYMLFDGYREVKNTTPSGAAFIKTDKKEYDGFYYSQEMIETKP